jgi:hypothetical protein
MAGPFSAQVNAWVAAVPERQEAVFKEAVQRIVSIAQTPVGAGGNMPVRDGFLRASVMATLGGSIPMQTLKPADGVAYSYNPAEVTLVIASAERDDLITIAWTANYARHVEYGARGRAGRRFLALAAQQWGRVVTEVATELQTRAQG